MAVYFALLNPGDTVLSMSLDHGGHLTHGHPMNFSGNLFNIVPYGVSQETEMIDYDEIERLAMECKPRMILAGASAYPRIIDFPRLRQIADKANAYLFVDMAHKRNHVLVQRDVRLVAGNLHFLARGVFRTQVNQHQVVVRAAGNDPEAFVLECLCQHGGVLHDLLLVCFEFRSHRFLEADGFRRDYMFQRSALKSGE